MAAWHLPVSISYTESMDGTQLYSFSDSGFSASGTSLAVVPFPICSSTAESVVAQYGSNLKNDHFEYVGYVQYLDSAGSALYALQFVGVQREAGDVTYFSHGYQCSWWNNCSNPAEYYSWNTSAGTAWGTLLPLGSTWGARGSRCSGKYACRSLSVPLTSTQQSNIHPTTCVNIGPDTFGYTYSSCSSLDSETTLTSGIKALLVRSEQSGFTQTTVWS